MHTWPPVYTDLFFDIGHVVFVGFLSSLVCVHAATYSSPCAAHGDSISCLIVTYLFPVFPHSVSAL